MHPYFTRLGVPRDVQLFFEPYYTTDNQGNLLFAYGDQFEHFGFAWHRVPNAVHPWQAGNEFSRQLLICSSAMEAIAFLTVHYHTLGTDLFFVAGTYNVNVSHKKIALVFGRDILGRLMDIHVATVLRNKRLTMRYAGDDRFQINEFTFSETQLTLNAFEKASGFRSGIRTYKPRGFNTFLEQLKHQIQ